MPGCLVPSMCGFCFSLMCGFCPSNIILYLRLNSYETYSCREPIHRMPAGTLRQGDMHMQVLLKLMLAALFDQYFLK